MKSKVDSEEVIFFNQKLKFSGTLYLPQGNQPGTAVVVIHPASAGERTDPFYDHLKSELPMHGVAVLVFDRRGSGASEGDFETADFEDLAGDVIAAVEYLQSRSDLDPARIGLHGTSQGGWIAPIAAARKTDIAFLIAVSACGVSPADQMDYGVEFHLKQDGYDEYVVRKAMELRRLVNAYFRGRVSREEVVAQLSHHEHESWYEKAYLYPSKELPADITQSKWYYEMDYEPLSVWQRVQQPTLFLFAEVDEWVPVEQSMINYERATTHLQDITLKQIQGTDHLMRDEAGEISQEYLSALIDWLTSRGVPNIRDIMSFSRRDAGAV
ncbi:MAG TPA: alpha/beta fold hydrolase [Anaerolineales bacterium]|nr:alpha/beta fold hydrolase [Anaerolineales bacterium]